MRNSQSRLTPDGKLRRRICWMSYATVAVASVGLMTRAAQATVEEVAAQVGLDLLRQVGPDLVGPPQQVLLNDQPFFLGSAVTTLSLSEVLGRFEKHCQDEAGELAQQLESLPKDGSATRAHAKQMPFGWLGSKQLAEDESVGHLVCLARRHSGGLRGLIGGISEFGLSGDVSALGDLRYVVARHDAAAGTTHVLTVWTEGPFKIGRLFAPNGDSPGQDSSFAPRPPQAIRVLSAEVPHEPFGVRMYDTTLPAAEVLGFYREEMRQTGWVLHPLPRSEGAFDLNEYASAYAKNDVAVLISTHVTAAGKTGVTLIELGANGFIGSEPKP